MKESEEREGGKSINNVVLGRMIRKVERGAGIPIAIGTDMTRWGYME